MRLTTKDRIFRALADVRNALDVVEELEYPPKYIKPALKKAERELAKAGEETRVAGLRISA